MKDVVGSTSDEKKMIKAIQRKLGALDNGYIGNQTMSDIAIAVKADCFPLNVELYSQPCIIAKDVEPFNPSGKLPANCISGSFSYSSKPCSVLVRNGTSICDVACHWWTLQKPESVLYKTSDGKVQIKRVRTVSLDLNVEDLVWAIGGMGLLDFYDPAAEGFTGSYADVVRNTNHTVLAYRNGMMYGVYFKSKTAAQINTICKEKMKFEYAILLDGGHVAAINGADKKINTSQKQYYAVKFI